jgi:hypothetical protein
MRRFAALVGLFVAPLAAATLLAQGPPPPGGRNPRRGGDVVTASVTKMMVFDADQDGKLSKSEVTDARLLPLFERADADQDGSVTKDELTALFTREASAVRGGGPGGPPPGGPGPGGPDGRGQFGPPGGGGGRAFSGPPPGAPPGDSDDRGRFGPPGGGRGRPPRPGEVLPGFLQDELQLTARQRAQLEQLQQDVDSRLAKILTDEQRERLNELSQRGPGGPPPGGPEDFGPPGERPQR